MKAIPDWPLAAEQELPLGAHLVTPRYGYLHHGIYAGGGRVVHYAGGFRRRPVEEISLARFAGSRPIWVKAGTSAIFDRQEIVCRARSRTGEDCYRLFTNNCEHFCEWCVRGEPRSLQVEALLNRPFGMLLDKANHYSIERIETSRAVYGAAVAPREIRPPRNGSSFLSARSRLVPAAVGF